MGTEILYIRDENGEFIAAGGNDQLSRHFGQL
jgi:hypothetical protein